MGGRYEGRLPSFLPFLADSGEGSGKVRLEHDLRSGERGREASGRWRRSRSRCSVDSPWRSTAPGRARPLDPAPCRGAREGARPGARPAPAPRADHRSGVARRHDRRGGAEAAQGGALRPAGHRRADSVVLRDEQRRALPRRRHRPSTSCGSRSSPAGRSPTRTSARPARRSRCTAVSCCPRTATRSGPRSAASSSASATSTCCASTVGGRQSSSSTPSDELAHLALMRRHAANGDRHAALRQFERTGPHAAARARRRAGSRGAGAPRPPARRARRRRPATTTGLVGRDR